MTAPVTYIDETEETARHCEAGGDGDYAQLSPPSSGHKTAEGASMYEGPPRHSKCPIFASSRRLRPSSSPDVRLESYSVEPAVAQNSLSQQEWPLKDPNEAALFRHYVQNLAIWVGVQHPPARIYASLTGLVARCV